MGTFNKGILGGFSGKVGTVIGSNWRGLNVMRSLPKKSGTNPSEQQVEQREKFAVATGFLKPISAVLAQYFGNPVGTSSRLNNAMSYHLKAAVIGASPNFSVDLNKVVVSKGETISAKDGQITAPNPAAVKVSWADNSGQVLAEPTDVALIVLYNSDQAEFLVTEGPASRQDAEINIDVPAKFAGETLHAWLSFVNIAQKRASTSMYLGSVVIT